MIKTRKIELTLVACFLAILAAPGLIQTTIELRDRETPQALNVFRQQRQANQGREQQANQAQIDSHISYRTVLRLTNQTLRAILSSGTLREPAGGVCAPVGFDGAAVVPAGW